MEADKTWIKKIFTGHGQYNFFIHRKGYGGQITSVTEIRCPDTTREVRIPLEIKDDEQLKYYIELTKGDDGIE